MKLSSRMLLLWLATGAALQAMSLFVPAAQAQDSKPNILFIIGDDIGFMQPSIFTAALLWAKRPTSTASAMTVRSS